MPRGLGASRRGSPTLGLQTLIDRLQGKPKTRYKLSALPITTDQADYASHVLEKNRGAGRRFADATIAGSIGNPLRRIGGAAIKGGLEAQGPLRSRLRAAGTAGAKMLGKGELGKSVFEGGVAGAGIKTVQEGLEVGRARRTAHQYLHQQPVSPGVQKLAAAIDLAKKKGFGRLGQLITGSRAKALGDAATRSNARAHNLQQASFNAAKGAIDPRAKTVAAGAVSPSQRARGAFDRRAGRTNKLVDDLAAEHKSRKKVMGVVKGISGATGIAGGATAASHVGHKEASTELGKSLYVLTRALEPVAPTPLTPLMDDEVELEA